MYIYYRRPSTLLTSCWLCRLQRKWNAQRYRLLLIESLTSKKLALRKPSKQVASRRPMTAEDLPPAKVILFIPITVTVVLTFRGVEKLFRMWRKKNKSRVKWKKKTKFRASAGELAKGFQVHLEIKRCKPLPLSLPSVDICLGTPLQQIPTCSNHGTTSTMGMKVV